MPEADSATVAVEKFMVGGQRIPFPDDPQDLAAGNSPLATRSPPDPGRDGCRRGIPGAQADVADTELEFAR